MPMPALSENSMLTHQSVIAKALESIQSRQMKTEERNEVLIQTLADLQRKHNSLVQVVKCARRQRENCYQAQSSIFYLAL